MLEYPDWLSITSKIFRVDSRNPTRLITRESSTIEFKENFHKKTKWDEYAKTLASFANNKGGYLVFGIKNKPHELIGMSNNYFDDCDPAEFTQFLNSRLSPEINWHKYIHEIDGKLFGLIYVEENQFKPVIAISNGNNIIAESDIFYRYSGHDKKIRYPELKQMIESNRQREQELWMHHLQRIATIGVHNAAIFNPDDGIVTGKSGTFVIDRKLLPKLNFIREGEFRETIGSPVIRLVGEAQVLAAGDFKGVEFIERKAVRLSEIINFFLSQKQPSSPEYFIEQICYEQSGYLPIYYYIQMANLSFEQVKNIIDSQISNSPGKRKLIERFSKKDDNLYQPIPDNKTELSLKKVKIRQALINGTLDKSVTEDDIKHYLSILLSLRKEDISIDYLFPLIFDWYEKYRTIAGILRTAFYKAISHLDKELFCPSDFYIIEN